MTSLRARKIEALILAVAALALVLEGSDAQNEPSALMAALHALMSGPVTGALALVAASFLLRSLHHGVASTFCIVAATVWAVVGVLDHAARSTRPVGMSPDEVLVVATLCLALGALIDKISRQEWGYVISAALMFVGEVASLATLAAMTLTYSPDQTVTKPISALACGVLCILGFRQLYRHSSRALDSTINRLVGPVAIAGSVGTLLVGQLIEHHSAASHAQKVGWMLAASMLLLCLTFAAFTIIRLTSEVIVARRSTTKWKRLLGRQRSIMHGRTTALKRTQAHYKELFANVPVPVMLSHPSGTVIAANPAMLALLDVDAEEKLKATNFITYYADPEHRHRLIADWTNSDRSVHQGEVLLRRLNGEHRSVLYTSRVVRASKTGDIDYIQGTFTDITELRRAEATQRRLEGDLRLSQKLEAVGRLAAGIAHEINTPMQYIGDNVYFLKESYDTLAELLRRQKTLIADTTLNSAADLAEALRELDSETDVHEVLTAVPGALARTDDGIKSINRIVAAMKELAHPGDGAKTSTDVNTVINTAATVTRNVHKTVATMTLELGHVPNVLTYKNELCQVLINLIVNAAHAIESAQKNDRRPGMITIRSSADDNSIRIDVSDNGCGIPDSVMEKIFDPFFTTKEVGKGTGQGLALARTTIVDKHGGHIDVHSVVGQGSTFTITLPFKTHASS